MNKSVKKIPSPMKASSVFPNGFEADFLGSDAPAIQILNSLNTGVIVCNHSGEISFANTYASKILKCAQKDITQSRVEGILLPIEDIIESVQGDAQDRTRQEKNIQLKNGEEVTIGYHLSKVTIAGGNQGEHSQFVVTFQDITKWNALHRDRDRLLRIATVGDVLPTILHELKNPLAAITTAVEVLIEEVEEIPTKESKALLQAILGEIRRMKLVFEGIGSSHRELRSPTRMAVDEAIREAVSVLKAKAKSVGIVLSCVVDNMPPLFLDTAVVRAILFNLLSNAIDACRSGDEITVKAGLKKDARSFELIVRDTGCGMPKSVQAHCTELFKTTKPNGSGIGLSLCQNTVSAAGGMLHIVSEVNRGTCITVKVPLND
ncbi:MAG: ATP-binding protein [Nitrospirota bacterium]|nr:ATP-binding protein [Nitrospirota bacterium]